MTTELEKEFFKVFGVEKIECCKHFKYFDSKCDRLDSTEKCLDCIGTNKVYPKITDRKLLEMICIMNKHIHKHSESALCPVAGENLEEVKNYMLRLFNFNWPLLEKIFIQEIQQLFKEGE